MEDRSFPEATGEFAEGDATIFCDLDDSSILAGRDPYSIFDHLRLALEKKGYHGHVSVHAYIDENTLPREFTIKYGRAGIHITFVPQGDRYSRVCRILEDIIFWAMNHVNTPSSLVVLSKSIQENTLFSEIYSKAFEHEDHHNRVSASLESLVGEGIPLGKKSLELRSETLFVISGTSGVENGDMVNQLRQVCNRLHVPAIVSSNAYGDDEFLRNELLIYSKDKGVSRKEIHERMAQGDNIVLRVDDIDEALKLRDVLGNTAVFIFLVAESDLWEAVKSEAAMLEAVKSEERLVRLGRKVFSHLEFDYVVVVSTDRKLAVRRLKSIINAEKTKVCGRTLGI